MNNAKLHHFNPQFVLRRFADSAGRITTIRLPERKSRTTRVRETGAENHLYTIPDHPSGPDVFEKRLGEGIEADTAEIFTRVEGGEWPLPPDARDTLAEFIALQVLRGPEQRRRMETAASVLYLRTAGQLGKERLASWASNATGRRVSEAEVDELWGSIMKAGGAPISYTPRDHIELMGEVTEPIAAILAARPWTLVRFKQRALITCDAPVTPVPYEECGPFMGVGIATARFVLYPMSCRTGLIMRDPLAGSGSDDDLDVLTMKTRSGSLDDELVEKAAIKELMNERVAGHAVKNIYHHPDDSLFVPQAFR